MPEATNIGLADLVRATSLMKPDDAALARIAAMLGFAPLEAGLPIQSRPLLPPPGREPIPQAPDPNIPARKGPGAWSDVVRRTQSISSTLTITKQAVWGI